MDYDCTKPLGNLLEAYLDKDLDKICFELSLHGIVYEHQFPKIWSMVCKLNAHELCDLFTAKTRLRIWYAYDNSTCNFVFFDMDEYDSKEAIQASISYQTSKY